jgi:hypothetical protein
MVQTKRLPHLVARKAFARDEARCAALTGSVVLTVVSAKAYFRFV